MRERERHTTGTNPRVREVPAATTAVMDAISEPHHCTSSKFRKQAYTTRSQTTHIIHKHYSSLLLTYSPLHRSLSLTPPHPRSMYPKERICETSEHQLPLRTQTHLCNAIPCHNNSLPLALRIVVWKLECEMVEWSVERMQLGCSERSVNPSLISIRSFHHAHTSFDILCIWCGAPP